MSHNDTTSHDIATLAREHAHWIGVLIACAKKDRIHSDCLLSIAEYLADTQYATFDEMAREFE